MAAEEYSGHPAFIGCCQRFRLGSGQRDVVADRKQFLGFGGSEPQMLFAESGRLLQGHQRRNSQRGNVPADQEQVQRGRELAQERVHQFQDRSGILD